MKRCPQCDFIYEDDQSLCDMDGVLLVLDSRSLPNLHALAPVEVPVAPRSHWRHRTFPAMAALILATVFSLVYFVSTQRNATPPRSVSGASVTEPVAVPAGPVSSGQPTESNQAAPPPAEETNGASATKEEEKKPEHTKAAPAPSAKKATTTTPTNQRKPTDDAKKDESKVGSILKKTGRILKKPFKF